MSNTLNITIDSNFKDTSMKTIRPDIKVNKGIIVGYLENIEVKDTLIKEDSPMIEFKDKTIPRINFVFGQIGHDKDEEPARYIYSMQPQSPTLAEAYKDMFENNLKNDIRKVVHILKAFGVEWNEENAAKLNVFNYDPYDADAAIEAHKKFFDAIKSLLFVKEGKKVIDITKDKDGNPILLNFKLIYMQRNNKFEFPNNGSDFIEKFVKGKESKLFIDPVKKESIEVIVKPKAERKTVVPGANDAQGNGAFDVNEDFFKK